MQGRTRTAETTIDNTATTTQRAARTCPGSGAPMGYRMRPGRPDRARPGAPAVALVVALALSVSAGCDPEPEAEGIPIGLMLSYSGYLAAISANSERALILAIETANEAGGFDGRALRLIARDTRSDPRRALDVAHELVGAGVALTIGPDANDLTSGLDAMRDRVLLLPSFTTAADLEWRPASWFVMGPGTSQVRCELLAQIRADGRQRPVVVYDTVGYNALLSWQLGIADGLTRIALAAEASTEDRVAAIMAADADAFVLAAYPAVATPLFNGLLASGALDDPTRWYLSPTLHSPAFLASSPLQALQGMRGVAASKAPGAQGFEARFRQRWQDEPLDDAYPFYDAGAVAALALARALAREGTVPDADLGGHVMAVTRPGGQPVRWDEVQQGIERLRQGEEVEYVGLSGTLRFDSSGQSESAATGWWTISGNGVADTAGAPDCQ